MNCDHPDPNLCARLGKHIYGPLWDRFHHDSTFRNALENRKPVEIVKRTGYRALPCIHQGPVIEYCTGCQGNMNDVNACDLHEKCTRSFVSDAARACSLCHDYQAVEEPWYWISTAKLVRDTIALAGRLPRDVCGVGGVPRSGMIPAAILSRILHLPLYEVPEDGPPRQCSSGNGGRGIATDGPLLVVDDTLMWGSARKKVRMQMGGRRHYFGAVYVREGEQHQVDYYHSTVPTLHVLEWNWACNGGIRSWSGDPKKGKGFAVDLDGIICHDVESGGVPGDAYMVPRAVSVPLIVTGRPERTRAATERQLRELGCRWDKLVMKSDSEAETWQAIAYYKAREYALSGTEIFIESCNEQAESIWLTTGKPVICPRTETVYQITGRQVV